MRFQDQVVKLTQRALDDICRAALTVPEDKRDWSPMGEARPVLHQMQEVAASPTWYLGIIRDGQPPEREKITQAMRKAGSYDTVEKCVEAARANTSELCRVISEFPDSALEDEVRMPFGAGMAMTMADILMLHYWNTVYHTGQINQIQLMLGDQDMH